MEKLRVGLIGIGTPVVPGSNGGRGFGLLKAASCLKAIEPVAVCDLNEKLFKGVDIEFPDIKCYTDYEKMLNEVEMDIVIVGTPPTDHARFAIAVLKHDINVLSEIPVVYNLSEVDALLKAEKESKGKFMTGANPNFAGRLKDMQKMQSLGLLGDPYYMEVSYMHDLRHWFEDTPWRAEYEPIRYCTHSLGPLLTLFQEDLETVSCVDTGGWLEKNKSNRHDIMAAIFRTKSNRVIQLSVSFANNFRFRDSHRCVVHGTKGVFSWIENQARFNSCELPGAEKPVDLHSVRFDNKYARNPEALSAGHAGLDYAMFDNVVEYLLNDVEYPVSLREGLRMSLPGIFAHESAKKNGELTKIEYPWG